MGSAFRVIKVKLLMLTSTPNRSSKYSTTILVLSLNLHREVQVFGSQVEQSFVKGVNCWDNGWALARLVAARLRGSRDWQSCQSLVWCPINYRSELWTAIRSVRSRFPSVCWSDLWDSTLELLLARFSLTINLMSMKGLELLLSSRWRLDGWLGSTQWRSSLISSLFWIFWGLGMPSSHAHALWHTSQNPTSKKLHSPTLSLLDLTAVVSPALLQLVTPQQFLRQSWICLAAKIRSKMTGLGVEGNSSQMAAQ